LEAVLTPFKKEPQMAFYNFFARPVSNPETGNLAFVPATSLPPQSLRGGGQFYNKTYDLFSPQLMYGQEQYIVGLEGIEFSGIQSEGLIDMEAYIANLQSAG
jgi:hypothetical protein